MPDVDGDLGIVRLGHLVRGSGLFRCFGRLFRCLGRSRSGGRRGCSFGCGSGVFLSVSAGGRQETNNRQNCQETFHWDTSIANCVNRAQLLPNRCEIGEKPRIPYYALRAVKSAVRIEADRHVNATLGRSAEQGALEASDTGKQASN